MTTCVIPDCRRDPGRDLLICYTHRDDLAHWLRRIPDLYTLLDPTPTRHGIGRGAPGYWSAPPARLDVIAARDWRSLPDGDGDVLAAPAVLDWIVGAVDTVTHHCRFLLRNLTVLCALPTIDEVADVLGRLHRQLERHTGWDRRRPVVGHCTSEISDTEVCAAPLRLPESGEAITCSVCGGVYRGWALVDLAVRQAS
ncbi:hypothetical protein LX15_004790 [Streptoalloteichus tenebrarius]|uniref:Uncharacterized protein n=1 Tax=Streptoalloteichus tenebrarius (strain ATCC 17920 / DSM 40477 / JCM 4838 / CBS 697.72 / NBRC 16177 / NCIMB 11028 / NRRL B-12390 / A12253. 1 / ISP 5477) TaxID=1933 RepID=A0ABT1HZX7_STRSD|nr:hypothetical protein [Streptoalloteichus tenebrarius]MCP2261070.1 hypothetical protein [Streptoalloteichus tenebrarius]BFF03134.1 hypothetical protein GCM10020241_48090 [Streptoalloteichus tenebrarius]